MASNASHPSPFEFSDLGAGNWRSRIIGDLRMADVRGRLIVIMQQLETTSTALNHLMRMPP